MINQKIQEKIISLKEEIKKLEAQYKEQLIQDYKEFEGRCFHLSATTKFMCTNVNYVSIRNEEISLNMTGIRITNENSMNGIAFDFESEYDDRLTVLEYSRVKMPKEDFVKFFNDVLKKIKEYPYLKI